MDERTGADVGDFLKTIACTAVMLQSVLEVFIQHSLSRGQQVGLGVAYNLIKFTAPAFIVGILFTLIRNKKGRTLKDYQIHLKNSWAVFFLPTIIWTLAYLLIIPQVQLEKHYVDLKSFLWQFINGNAASHLWYNSMMLQFIVLIPIFWWIVNWVGNSAKRAWLLSASFTVLFFAWILFYDIEVFHGPHMHLTCTNGICWIELCLAFLYLGFTEL